MCNVHAECLVSVLEIPFWNLIHFRCIRAVFEMVCCLESFWEKKLFLSKEFNNSKCACYGLWNDLSTRIYLNWTEVKYVLLTKRSKV